jgi:glycosyltransferase involved in cell wall biosynthesis
VRVLRVSHSAVVSEYRWRERLLRARGHDVHTVVPPAFTEGGSLVHATADPDVPLHVVDAHGPRRPNLFWFDVAQLRRVIREVRPEIVDIHEEPYAAVTASVLWAMRRERLEVPFCLYTAQNIVDRDYPPPFSRIETRALSGAAAAFPCSAGGGERLRRRGYRGPIHVIGLGVNPISRAVLAKRLAAAAADPGATQRVGFVGRLEGYKGGLMAVRAFAEAGAGRNAVLEMIGDGPEAGAIREEARRLGVADRVNLLGALSQEETLQRLDGLEVILMPSLSTPSWKEQYGRVAAQAMAHGAAVIAFDSGALGEVVADAGLLVPEGDVDGMASALAGLLREPARMAQLQRAGRDRAAAELSWASVTARVEVMYQQAWLRR